MSFVRRVGNRAFQALNDAFSIPGPENLNSIDIGVASPVIELKEIVRESLLDVYTFQLEIDHVGAATTDQRISPFVSGDWTNIFVNGQETNTAVETQAGLNCLFVNAGAVASANLDFLILEERPLQGSSVTATPLLPYFLGDTLTGGRITSSTGTPFLQPLPWDTVWAHHARFVSTGASNMRLTMMALVGPRGIIPRTGYEL